MGSKLKKEELDWNTRRQQDQHGVGEEDLKGAIPLGDTITLVIRR